MAIVIPRSRSAGALSIESNARYLAPPCVASTLVIAAVSVVLTWSMCPIVPTFTCGLLRTNFCFAMSVEPTPQSDGRVNGRRPPVVVLRSARWLLEDRRLAPVPAQEVALFKTHKTSHHALVPGQTSGGRRSRTAAGPSEPETGIEPVTPTLPRLCSTPELLGHAVSP